MSRPHKLYLVSPPYMTLRLVNGARSVGDLPTAHGQAIVWAMGSARDKTIVDSIASRRPGITLLTMLPAASELSDTDAVLEMMERCRPHTIMPFHPEQDIEEWVSLLRRGSSNLPADLVDFLYWRGVRLDRETRELVRNILDLSRDHRTITRVSKRLYMSRRALGRRFHNRGLPAPSRWLQFARVLRTCELIQATNRTVAAAARSQGYPDGFSFSNQLLRLTGVRPTTVREALGWEWIAEAWIDRELGLRKPLTVISDHVGDTNA